MSVIHQGQSFQVVKAQDYISVFFDQPMQSLSSCVLNGGFQEIDSVWNVKVDADAAFDASQSPSDFLSQKIIDLYLEHDGHEMHSKQQKPRFAGFMTAASMNSVRVATQNSSGLKKDSELEVTAIVTTGMDNAKRIGSDSEEKLEASNKVYQADTINIILIMNAQLSNSAMVEAVQMITEAKVAALQNIGFTKSGVEVTGTGTDAVLVACPTGSESSLGLEYVGKHTIAGELIGKAVIQAMQDSLSWYKA